MDESRSLSANASRALLLVRFIKTPPRCDGKKENYKSCCPAVMLIDLARNRPNRLQVVMNIAGVRTILIKKRRKIMMRKKAINHSDVLSPEWTRFQKHSLFLRFNVIFWHILHEVQRSLFRSNRNKDIFHQNQTHFSYTLPSISSVAGTFPQNRTSFYFDRNPL